MMPLVLSLCLAAPQPPEKKEEQYPAKVQESLYATVQVTSEGADFRRGSGVTIGIQDNFAYVLTASHVLGRETNLRVSFMTKKSSPRLDAEWEAKAGEVSVAARRPVPDFAILKVTLPRRIATKDEPKKDDSGKKEALKVSDVEMPGVARLAPPLERPKRFPSKAYSAGFSRPEKEDDTPRATLEQFELVGKKLKFEQAGSNDFALVWVSNLPSRKG